ncbi:AraC family transcriptional regulator [uncultured Maribacter sp.]|uniref:AraC family transcriptional regulator n=1 Tax=uncultured Maribacter sp. TaxID=431308 RepID=UPI00261BB33B|nr:AraC family transcriptional regulator [uncultured Maribacter sp.]
MKPQLIKVPNKTNASLYIANERVPYFYNPFHYHSKLELTYIIESSGTRYIGNHVQKFNPGELVLVGPNVPHCWKNDSSYFSEKSIQKAHAIVIHFDLNFLGESFWQVSEMILIKRLLSESKSGIKFSKKITNSALQKLINLEHLTDPLKLISFIEILELLSNDNKRKLLSSTPIDYSIKDKNLIKINNILNYISNNYKEDLSIQQLSEITHLTPNAFCRYFKKHTRKTFKEYLNELRISNVCKFLQETDMSINEIAYSSGYNNLSHFIKMFKKFKNIQPNQYRKKIQETKSINNKTI